MTEQLERRKCSCNRIINTGYFFLMHMISIMILPNLGSKMDVWGGLTNSCENKRSKKQRRKGKIYACECSVSKNSKEK